MEEKTLAPLFFEFDLMQKMLDFLRKVIQAWMKIEINTQ